MINVLAQGHNTVMPVRLEPAAPRSEVKHSTTELPTHLLFARQCNNYQDLVCLPVINERSETE